MSCLPGGNEHSSLIIKDRGQNIFTFLYLNQISIFVLNFKNEQKFNLSCEWGFGNEAVDKVAISKCRTIRSLGSGRAWHISGRALCSQAHNGLFLAELII